MKKLKWKQSNKHKKSMKTKKVKYKIMKFKKRELWKNIQKNKKTGERRTNT